ncbi:MAG: amidohydrolase family protein [Sphaerochaetaceae bacterium]
MREVGIRGCTCYEVTDRNQGMKEVEEGIQENIDFALGIDQSDQRRLVEAMIGAHASFTVPEEALKLLKEAVDTTHRGLHIHVAEDSYDVSHSHHRYHKDIITRLDEAALLTDNTLLVHALHLNENEIRRVNQRGSFVAHNPRSNMNNQVGYMKHLAQVNNLVLGTDGCGGNMFEELKIAFFKHRDALGTLWPPDFFKALNRGNQLLQKSFGRRFGRIESGYVADLVVLDYQSPTALVPENVASHFVWGISSNAVESVMVNGKMVLNQRIFPFDEKEIYAKAAQIAKRIWKRVDHLRS